MEKKHEVTPEIEKLMKRFIEENGDSLREVLEETDEFLWDSIQTKKWTYRDTLYIHDIVLFILNSQIKKGDWKCQTGATINYR